MPAVIEVKVIRAKKMNIPAVRNELLMALRYEGEDIQAEYKKTTETWNNPPEFEIITDITGNEASVLVGTDNKIYKFLDEGTHIRWALMSRDWSSKTRVRHIGSFAGSGHVIGAGKRFMLKHGIAPRPGIQAREFSKTIQQRRRDKFTRRMIEAARRGAQEIY